MTITFVPQIPILLVSLGDANAYRSAERYAYLQQADAHLNQSASVPATSPTNGNG